MVLSKKIYSIHVCSAQDCQTIMVISIWTMQFSEKFEGEMFIKFQPTPLFQIFCRFMMNSFIKFSSNVSEVQTTFIKEIVKHEYVNNQSVISLDIYQDLLVE